MQVVSATRFYQALAEAMELPKGVTKMSLHLEVDKPVTIECEIVPHVDLGLLTKVMRSFELVPADVVLPEVHPAEVMGFDAWMRERTERAHQEYMRRTGSLP